MFGRHLVAAFLSLAIITQVTPALAQSYNALPIQRSDAEGILWWKAARQPRGLVVVVPGAQMTGGRYSWLTEALVAAGFSVVLPEAALTWFTPPGASDPLPSRYVQIPHALAALEFGRNKWPNLADNTYLIGHSLGGAIVLELLDPAEAARNPNTRAPEDFTGVEGVRGAVILGTSLQADTPFMTLPYRSESRALSVPEGTRLLFVTAEHDAMATPELMRKTAARYKTAVEVRMLPGGNHLNWSEGLGMMDRPDYDGEATITERQQLDETITLVKDFLAATESGAAK